MKDLDKLEGQKLFSPTDSTAPKEDVLDDKEGNSKKKSTANSLGKDELAQYINDPFWVNLRWISFICFWLIWVALLGVTAYVIFTSPKCMLKETADNIWKTSPLYKIDLNLLERQNNQSIYTVLDMKMDDLKKKGVSVVLLDSFLESGNASDEIINFKNVSDILETVDHFKIFLTQSKVKGIDVLLNISINHASIDSDMFARSTWKDEPYTDYFIWDARTDSSEKPNNWLSVYGGSAWEWSKVRKEFYLHKFRSTQADFNFRNQLVIEYFNDVLKYWMDLGAKGYYLFAAEQMVEDNELRDDALSHKPGYTHDQYSFLNHARTEDQDLTAQIIKEWKKIISSKSGYLLVSSGVDGNSAVVDGILRPVKLPPNFTAKQFDDKITQFKSAAQRPVWKWECESGDYRNCFSVESINALNIISFLLPGIPFVEMGTEFDIDRGNYNITDTTIEKNTTGISETSTRQELYGKLIKLRNEPSISNGKFRTKVLNETIFAFVRIKDGAKNYAVAWNVGINTAYTDFNGFEEIPKLMKAIIKSGNKSENEYDMDEYNVVDKVEIPPKTAIVYEF